MVGAQGEFPGITGGPDKGYIAIAPRDTTGAGAEASLSIGPVTEHFSNQARNSNASLVYGLAPTFAFVPAGKGPIITCKPSVLSDCIHV